MIPKLNFVFDKEKDLKNIWETCNTPESYGESWKNAVTGNLYKICHNKKWNESKKELEKELEHFYQNKIFRIMGELFSKTWKKVEKDYFTRLKKIMKDEFYFKKVTVYMTSSNRCPYDPSPKNPSFYVRFFSNVPLLIQSCEHELMHIQFHNSKYWKICERGIGREKTFDIKESLTVLLNLELGDLSTFRERGYPHHKELRKFITAEWEKEKDFDVLIQKLIKWIKKNGIK